MISRVILAFHVVVYMEASDMSQNVDRRDRPERCGVIELNIFNVVDKDYFGMDSLNDTTDCETYMWLTWLPLSS